MMGLKEIQNMFYQSTKGMEQEPLAWIDGKFLLKMPKNH